MSTKIKNISNLVISTGALIALSLAIWSLLTPQYGPQFTTYMGEDFDSMVDHSDIVFVGKVTGFSPTKWNQDSGEPWPGGFMYHIIQFEVSQYIVDRIGLSNKNTIEVLLLESSPLDSPNKDNGLSIGSVAVVFAGNANIGWREGGKKPFIEAMSGPTASIFVQDDKGKLHGEVFHNLGEGKFSTFATRKGQEKYLLGMEERKTNPKKDPGGGGGFMPEWVSISLPDFIAQIQAADQNQPFEFDSTVTPTDIPADRD